MTWTTYRCLWRLQFLILMSFCLWLMFIKKMCNLWSSNCCYKCYGQISQSFPAISSRCKWTKSFLWWLHLFLKVCGAGLLGSNFLLFPSSLNWVLALLVENEDLASICHSRENDFLKSNNRVVVVFLFLKTPLHLKHRGSIIFLKPMSEAIRQRYEDTISIDLQENI